MTLTGKEFLGNVKSASGVVPTVLSWVVNPRSAAAFQKASIIALNFNKYRMTNLAICYTPSCSFETNGRVAIGWNDDVADPVPSNKMQLYGLGLYQTTQAQTAMRQEIPCDGKVRFMHDSTSDDPKLVDLGRIILTTYGFNDSSQIVGELFLEYSMVLSDPTFTSQVSQIGTAETSTGPEYASLAVEAGAASVVLNSPGKWLVTLIGNSGTIKSPTIIGAGAFATINYSNDVNAAIADCVVDTQSDGTKISTTTTGVGLVSWRVSRY